MPVRTSGRLAAFISAVSRHTRALATAFIGGLLVGSPAWLRPLLKPEHQATLDRCSGWLLEPHNYAVLAITFTGGFVFYACFLAWDESQTELTQATDRLTKLETPELFRFMESMSIGPDTPDLTRNQHLRIRLNILIVNSGTPTSLHGWGVNVLLRSGETVPLESWHIEEQRKTLDGLPNIVRYERVVDRGGRVLGRLEFDFYADPPLKPLDIRQVSVHFYDAFGNSYALDGPDLPSFDGLDTDC
jgi:hypothetical protein